MTSKPASTVFEKDYALSNNQFGDHARIAIGDVYNGGIRETPLQWLFPPAYDSRHQEIKRERVAGIGKWCLTRPEYRQWRSTPSGSDFILCSGGPGTGKTFLSLVIDDIIASLVNSNEAAAYIYFDHANKAMQKAETTLASLLKQIFLQTNQQSELVSLRERCEKRSSRPWVEELFEILESLCKLFQTVFFVFDALDECEERERRIIIEGLERLKSSNCRLFATSRPHIKFPSLHFERSTDIEIPTISEDIGILIKSRIEDEGKLLFSVIEDDPKLANDIVQKISTDCTNMILLASLILDDLSTCTDASQINKVLKSAPTSFSAFYERTLKRIRSQSKRFQVLAYRSLRILTSSQRTLSPHELGQAISIESNDTRHSLQSSTKPAIVERVCMGLIVVPDSLNIRLAHFSMEQHLRRHLNGNDGRPVGIESDVLARSCLTILLFDEFCSGPCESTFTLEQRMQNYPFFRYAACYWAYHANQASKELQNLARILLLDSKRVAAATQCIIFEDSTKLLGRDAMDIKTISTITGLHLAAYCGYLNGVVALIQEQVDINECFDGKSPLTFAAYSGHLEIVNVLLRHTELNPNGESTGGTPLYYAVLNGHSKVVSALLNHPNTFVDKGAVIYAARKGATNILELLVEKVGVTVEQMISQLLSEAISGKIKNLVRELISLNKHLLEDPRRKFDLIQLALEWEDVPLLNEIAKFKRGLEATNEDGYTALHLAAKKAENFKIRMLHRSGADLNAETLAGATPIVCALDEGHFSTFDLLCELGADLSSDTTTGQTTLPVASFANRKDVVTHLLDTGADPNTMACAKRFQSSFESGTALFWAAYNGHTSLVELLLAYKANPDIPSGPGAIRNDVEVSWFKSEAEVSFYGGVTPLICAARKGSIAIAKLLLNKGASINAQSALKETALHAAAHSKNQDLLLFLLEEGADPTIVDSLGRTALIIATVNGLDKAVRGLIDSGVPVDARADISFFYDSNDYTNYLNHRWKWNIRSGKNTARLSDYLRDSERLEFYGGEYNFDASNTRIKVLNMKDGYALLTADETNSDLSIESLEVESGSVHLHIGAGCTVLIESIVMKGGALFVSCDVGRPRLMIKRLQLVSGVVNLRCSGSASLQTCEINGGFFRLANHSSRRLSGCLRISNSASTTSYENQRDPKEPKKQREKGLYLFPRTKEPHGNRGREALQKASDPDDYRFIKPYIIGTGLTALHIASLSGQVDVAKVLLDHSANINIESNGQKPIEIAAEMHQVDMVRFLLRKGAKTNHENEMVQLAIHILNHDWAQGKFPGSTVAV